MELYDVAKTQKLIAENKTDKEISERLYELCRHVVKELAEGYQIIDKVFQNLVTDMEELNMPHKPNPFQCWHEVSLQTKKKDVNIPHAGSPKMMKKYLKSVNKISKVVRLISSASGTRNKLRMFPNSGKNRTSSTFKRKGEKIINESLIKKAIEETDCNLNLSKKKKPSIKKEKLDNITILTYVAKCFALLGNKVKLGMKKHKKNTNLFADAIMPVSMKPRLIIENFELCDQKQGYNMIGTTKYKKLSTKNLQNFTSV